MNDAIRSVGTATVACNAVWELELTAACVPADPWAEIELDVEFTDPGGRVRAVPAFWAGGRSWRVRYSSAVEGVHRYRSVVRAAEETGLADVEGELTVTGYGGANALLLHGAPRVAADGRHLAHADGTPFLWLGDTWWSGMTKRFRWPEVFQTLADDRAAKGFSVVQIVAGLVPEFDVFTPRMASEGGQPWLDEGIGPINPAYWDVPDLKLEYLIEQGIVPCIVGGWGYYAQTMGRERILSHWRYLVARYGAYPVVWCIAGEVDLVLPITLPPEQFAEQVAIWEDASRLVAEIDPFERVRTVHPCPLTTYASSETFGSRDTFELDMMQTGHTGRACMPDTMTHLRAALAHGDKPVLNGECSYEGIFDACGPEVQRVLFWSHMLSGAAGHTYGTMAISTFNSRTDPHMPPSRVSMHFWEDAIDWLGAEHVGVGKRILERLPWWELRPAQETIAPHAGPDDGWLLPYAAKAPDGSMVVWLPGIAMVDGPSIIVDGPLARLRLSGLEPGASYAATWVSPRSGRDDSTFSFAADDDGVHTLESEPSFLGVPTFVGPTGEDWVLLVAPVR